MEQQYEEMLKAKKRFWGIFLPLLVYIGVRFLAHAMAEYAVLAANMGKLFDVNQIFGMTFQQQTDFLREFFTNATNQAMLQKIIIENMVLISAIAAVLLIPVGVTFFVLDRKKAKETQLPRVHKEAIWKYPLMPILGVALCIGLNVIILMVDQAFFDGATSKSLAPTYLSPMVLQVIGVGVLVPISEEFFYRGVLFNRYREYSTYARAGVYSALLFALAHGSMLEMLYAFVLGTVLSYAYEKFGSITAPILMHMTVNLTSVLLTNLNGFGWLLAKPLRACFVTCACAFVGASIIVYLQRVEGRDYGTEEKKENKDEN